MGSDRGLGYRVPPWGALAALVACASSALAGCGGSSKHTATANAAPAAVVARLDQRVLRSGELAGMVAASRTPVVASATKWAANANQSGNADPSEVKRLQGLGFVAGLAQQLSTPGNSDRFGLSLVEELGSHDAAVAEVSHSTASNGPWIKFAAPGIPGAVGFESPPGSGGGRNIAFADGRFYYVVGDGWNTSSKDAVPRATLIAAATSLYRRVRGLPGG